MNDQLRYIVNHHLFLFAFGLESVIHHQCTKGAIDRNNFGSSLNEFLYPFGIDFTITLFFLLKGLSASCTTTQSFILIGVRFEKIASQFFYYGTRCIIFTIDSAQITGIVINNFLSFITVLSNFKRPSDIKVLINWV